METSFYIIILVYIAILGFSIVGHWKLYEKADKPGWTSIIPIYNMVVWFEITGRPIWHLILVFIPIVNIVILIMAIVDLCKSFGKTDVVDYLLAIFLGVFYIPYLGFASDVHYVGPARSNNLTATVA